MVNKTVWNALLGCSLKNDRMISVRFQGKPFNITVIQVYAPTSNTKEAEVEQFYEDLQDLLELTPKKDVLLITGDWNCKSRKLRNTWSNRQIWPWNMEWSRVKTNTVLPRKCTGHSKYPLPTTQEKYSLSISNFLEEISSLSHSVVVLYFFALITEEGFLISPCYSLELCIPGGISFLFSFAFHFSCFHSFVRPPQRAILLFCISFSWGWSWSLSPVQYHEPPSIVHQALCLSDLAPYIYFSLPLYNHKGSDLGHYLNGLVVSLLSSI